MQTTTRPAPKPPATDTRTAAHEVARMTEAQREQRKARGVCTHCGLRAPVSALVETCTVCQRAAFGGL